MFLCKLNNYNPNTNIICSSLGPYLGEFIPGEPRMPEINMPDGQEGTSDTINTWTIFASTMVF